MELSERCIAQLEKEGFASIYEWTDAAGTVYPEHSHKNKVTIFITDGTLEFTIDNSIRSLRTGDRLDVPPGIPHTATVGLNGCNFVVGEMIPGDS